MVLTADQPERRQDYFVTGTDTGVGKTLVAGALLHALNAAGHPAAGMKPVAAGAYWRDGQWRNEDVDCLLAASGITTNVQLHNPYLFVDPVAPHLAARKEGRAITIGHVLDCYRQLGSQADAVVVEGVGGFIVPLAEHLTTADLARQLDLPVLLTVGLRLGCINHALTTALAIQHEGLILAGWVANTVDPDMLLMQDNINTLRQWLPAPYLGHIPYLPGISSEQAASFINWQELFEGDKARKKDSGA